MEQPHGWGKHENAGAAAWLSNILQKATRLGWFFHPVLFMHGLAVVEVKCEAHYPLIII